MVIIDDKWVLGSFCRRTAAPEREEQLVQTSLASFPAEVVNPIKAKTKQNKKTGHFRTHKHTILEHQNMLT